ncbi:hypothetical protein [Polyangium mundeleinium]|uniref:Uncharacterized protein n=1 Tax=Polyangium mundeleinium TaxID=2995306 RepID=A0ABT5F782_9BACT|nr:hypothetical protein [Polyangium mundeleinium]MDC0749968.1 hypothetical protein [Polyangium mundeleinium]
MPDVFVLGTGGRVHRADLVERQIYRLSRYFSPNRNLVRPSRRLGWELFIVEPNPGGGHVRRDTMRTIVGRRAADRRAMRRRTWDAT